MAEHYLTAITTPSYPLTNRNSTASTLTLALTHLAVGNADRAHDITDQLIATLLKEGNLFLLIFGLALSIPFVVFTSNLLSMLMDRYPILLYIGAAVLGRVAG